MDAKIADMYLNRESDYERNLEYALQAGLLSLAGDGVIIAAKPMLKGVAKGVKGVYTYAKEHTPLGLFSTIPSQNINAANKIIDEVFSPEMKEELKQAQKEFGGGVRAEDLANPVFEKLKESFAKKYGQEDKKTKSVEKLAEIFNQNSLKTKQQEMLDLIRSDKDGSTLAYLLEVAKDDVKIQNNLKNMLNLASANVEKNLKNLNINPREIKSILDEFEAGNKAAFKEVENQIAKLYNEDIKVVLDRNTYENIKEDFLQNGVNLDEMTPFLRDLENNVFSKEGVSFAKLNNFRKNLNYYIFNKDKTPGFINTLKKIAETSLKAEIDKGIDNIFSELPKAYESIKELYSTSLKDYAAMKELNESIKNLKLQDSAKSADEVVDNLIKYAKGQGEGGVNNLQKIKAYLGEENNAFLEMQILNRLFKESVIENDRAKVRVFDSESFLNRVKELVGENELSVFKSKEAREFLELVEGFDKLYKNDAIIAKNFTQGTASKLSTSIATSAEGAIKQKVVKGAFDPIFRLLPDGVLFGLFSKQIQGGALRYHLKKALSRSLNYDDFKLKLERELKRTNFNSNTSRLIEKFMQNLEDFNAEKEAKLAQIREAEALKREEELKRLNQIKTAQENAYHTQEANLGQDILEAELREDFGVNFEGFKGKEAVLKLLEEKRGQVKGAFYKEGLGEIDLVWGDENFGLRHILNKHGGEFENLAEQLSEIITKGEVLRDNDRATLKYVNDNGDIFKVGLKGNWKGETTKNKWIITAYKDEREMAKTIDSSDFTKGETLPLNSNESIAQKAKSENTQDFKRFNDAMKELYTKYESLGSYDKIEAPIKMKLLQDEIKPEIARHFKGIITKLKQGENKDKMLRVIRENREELSDYLAFNIAVRKDINIDGYGEGQFDFYDKSIQAFAKLRENKRVNEINEDSNYRALAALVNLRDKNTALHFSFSDLNGKIERFKTYPRKQDLLFYDLTLGDDFKSAMLLSTKDKQLKEKLIEKLKTYIDEKLYRDFLEYKIKDLESKNPKNSFFENYENKKWDEEAFEAYKKELEDLRANERAEKLEDKIKEKESVKESETIDNAKEQSLLNEEANFKANFEYETQEAKQKTINKVDEYAKSEAFKALSKDKQEAILSLKSIKPSIMPENIKIQDLQHLQEHFKGKLDEKQREKFLSLFNDTKQNADLVLEVLKNGEKRQEYIKAYQHKESKDLYYIAISKDERDITGIPTTQIQKIINDIAKSERVIKAENFGEISNTAAPLPKQTSPQRSGESIAQKAKSENTQDFKNFNDSVKDDKQAFLQFIKIMQDTKNGDFYPSENLQNALEKSGKKASENALLLFIKEYENKDTELVELLKNIQETRIANKALSLIKYFTKARMMQSAIKAVPSDILKKYVNIDASQRMEVLSSLYSDFSRIMKEVALKGKKIPDPAALIEQGGAYVFNRQYRKILNIYEKIQENEELLRLLSHKNDYKTTIEIIQESKAKGLSVKQTKEAIEENKKQTTKLFDEVLNNPLKSETNPKSEDIIFTDTKGKEHTLTKQTQEEWLNTFNLKSLNEAYTPKHSDEIKEALGGKEIKLQLGSLKKLIAQGREQYIPQIKEVLDSPEAILKDSDNAFLFAKHLKDDDYFVNVSVDKGEYLVSISNGIKKTNNIKNKLDSGAKVVYQSPNANSNLQTLLQTSRYSANKIDEDIIAQNAKEQRHFNDIIQENEGGNQNAKQNQGNEFERAKRTMQDDTGGHFLRTSLIERNHTTQEELQEETISIALEMNSQHRRYFRKAILKSQKKEAQELADEDIPQERKTKNQYEWRIACAAGALAPMILIYDKIIPDPMIMSDLMRIKLSNQFDTYTRKQLEDLEDLTIEIYHSKF